RLWEVFVRLSVFAILLALTASLAATPQSVSAQHSGPPPISVSELQEKAREACRSAPTFGPGAVQQADMDGDGRTDVLFNWAEVTCSSGSAMQRKGAGFCGMHNCSIDVYLSSQYKPGGWPKPILNHQEIAPQVVQSGGQSVLRTSYQGGSCAFAKVCQREWSWNGAKLVSREIEGPVSANAAVEEPALTISEQAIVGHWVEAPDGCATDATLVFEPNGDYASYEQTGDWRLLGNRIAVVVRETFILGEAGSRKPVENPTARLLEVLSVRASSLQLRGADGKVTDLRRCK
ncbi:MAG: hypothetical protein AAFY19_11970, partial [Pseudomonadota bacterium]